MIISGITISTPKFINGSLANTVKNIIINMEVPIIYPSNIFWLLVSAFIFYWFGAFGITVFGNIPLNEILDKTALETFSLEELKSLRTSIELKWNNLNLIRTISSLLTFILLVISYTLMNR